MSENKTFFGLWTVVRDSESARAAMRSSQITAFYLTFSYLVNVVFLLWMGQTPFSSVPADNIEKYFELEFKDIIPGRQIGMCRADLCIPFEIGENDQNMNNTDS